MLRWFVIGMMIFSSMVWGIRAEEETKPVVKEQPPIVAPVAEDENPGEEVAAEGDKPLTPTELKARADFLRKAAAYWRENGDEEKAGFFEQRAKAIEDGTLSPAELERLMRNKGNIRPRDKKGPAAEPGKRPKQEKEQVGVQEPQASPMMENIDKRAAELEKQIAAADEAGDKEGAARLRDTRTLLQVIMLQDGVIREQGKRIKKLDNDIETIKDLLRKLAGDDKEGAQ